MLFSSMTFVFLFLPILGILYGLISKFFPKTKYKNYLLLMASILFYAWGEPRYLPIILMTILINYAGALCLERCLKYKRTILGITVFANLGFLIYFKYIDFIIGNINTLFTSDFNLVQVALPLGISFYTFQAMSYLIDVYRGIMPAQRNLGDVALYICLFPQLIAGPIVQYTDMGPQIAKRTENFDKIVYGIKRFIVGLSKKVLLANTLGNVADKIFDTPTTSFSPLVAWVGAVAYTFNFFMIFRVTLIWQSDWDLCSGLNFRRTLIIPIFQNLLRNFGIGGILHCRPGLKITCIFL